MSIFGKKPSDLIPDINLFETRNANMNSTASQPKTQYNKPAPKYTIEQAIKLVSSLKDHNVSARVIAGIMKQTLESVDIHFTDIIDDAKQKESAIHAESSKKDEMIRELSRRVEALQMEKVEIQKELNKTVYVREFLQQALNDTTVDAGDTDAPPPRPAQSAKNSAANNLA